MTVETPERLRQKACKPCEGGVQAYSLDSAREQVKQLGTWELAEDGERIRRRWRTKNFMAGMEFLNKVAELAEAEGHHPDIHLVGYRNVTIELTTHAIGGLSDNDFIIAAKIDRLPIAEQ